MRMPKVIYEMGGVDKDPSDIVREFALIWQALPKAEGLADAGLGRGSEHDGRAR
jgi:hypothetical protein